MDAAATTAWLVVGVVLGALAAAALVSAVVLSRRRTPPARGRPPEPVDDLADFLEHPPGTRPQAPGPSGWAALAPPEPGPPAGDRQHPWPVPAALCVAALALAGTAAAVAAAATADPSPAARSTAPSPAPAAGTVADLVVGGLVLEPRAVGVTAAYPELRLGTDDGAPRLELRLPTYNCLTAEAPADPVAAGCTATPVEHAVLEGDDVRITRDGAGWVLRGSAATVLHPGGSPPEATGRVYPLELTVTPEGPPTADGTRAARGELRLGTGSAPVLAERSRVRTAG
ncbi:hypothetical protein E9549_07200 [Blastococcus sp. MG754426]|uniref:hypothetical protein n=1 Tax=unclassified Blastococcus TaxID=2619396 RepID=UPI001EEF8C96|nr:MULTISPECIES: hypothetical protein [unclassified Blastococcus]MCF6507192.1 hypothetical protein [Blastococcus sp. MG754426]MCF6513918.1 hypothetical protein [Blastococcus sp. MG754427]